MLTRPRLYPQAQILARYELGVIAFGFDDFVEIWFRFMKRFHWFKQISSNGKLERRLSLVEYKRAISWSKYLVSSGAAIKGGGEEAWSADMSEILIGNDLRLRRHGVRNQFIDHRKICDGGAEDYRGVYLSQGCGGRNGGAMERT
ncbi:hypothetical protein Acr_16g0003580 [Actinidia rufa]|uniref:Uncharacterized protein n=1 Tax=Actinidia rufa TaxID=165716 RepID=A0A7J0FYU8_9ERIC|nr:hypothetical protein Acr_16g0003580 [Actinidia rufa]